MPLARLFTRLASPTAVIVASALAAATIALPAQATTTINHQFTPATVNPGDVSKYRVTLTNDDIASSLTGMKVTVLLPPQVTVASLAGVANTCSFTVSQPLATGGSTVELIGGTLAAGAPGVPSQCYFEVDVSATAQGNWIASIPANPVSGPNPPGTPTVVPDATTAGYLATTTTTGVLVANATAANATLAVNTLLAPTGNKTFSPSPAIAGNPVTLTITLTNPNPAATMPLTTFTDTLPDDGLGHAMLVNGTPVVACTGTGKVDGTVSKAPDNGSITLTGSTIGNGGTCTITVPVVVPAINGTSQSFVNTLAPGAIGNTRGLVSASFGRTLTVDTPIVIAKSFGTTTIPAGQSSLMTLTITNRSTTSALDIASFADDLTGTTLRVLTTASTPVAAAADPAVVCTGVGAANGTLAYSPDALDTSVSLANAIAGPSGTCTITSYVTSYVDGAHVNTTGTVGNPLHNWASTAASASLTAVAQLRVSKGVTVSSVAPGQWTEFAVTIQNYTGGVVDNVLFRDLLPTGGGQQLVVYDPAGAGIYSTTAGCLGGTFTGLTAGGASTGSAPVSGTDAGLQWSGGAIAAGSGVSPGACTIRIRAQVPAGTASNVSFTNTIAQGSVTGTGPGGDGVSNPDTTGTAGIVTVDSIAVSKSFAPGSIAQGGTSTLSIVVRNRTVNPVTGVDLTDNLPAGVALAANPAPTNGCGGTLQAFPGDTAVRLTAGSLGARPDASQETSCTITVRVTSTTVGSHANTIRPADFTSSAGTISGNATASLNVTTGITGTKSFLPAAVTPGGVSRATVTITNASNRQLTNVSVDDSGMGAGLVVANPANAATSCAGSPTLVVNPGATQAQMQGATLNAGASCTFSFDVATSGTGPWTNSVAAGNVRSAEGVTNTSAISASLGVNAASININKSFLTPIVTGGVPSVLQIDVTNSAAITIHGAAFTDTFPNGIQVYSVPGTSTTCAGATVSAIPGDGKVVVSGATLAANSTCQVRVTVTSVRFLNLTNTIPAGSVTSAEGYTNPLATAATLSTLQGLGVMKGFSPAYIGAGQTSRLRVTVVSTFDPNAVTPTTLTGVTFSDNLPAGVTVAAPANAATTCSDGSGGFAAIVPAGDGKSFTMTGATIPPGSSCHVDLDVTASVVGSYDNTIPIGGVASAQGVVTQNAATARLSVVNQPTLSKSFSPATVQIGQVSRLTVTVANGSGTALSGIAVADTLPAGLAIAATPNATTTCGNGVVAAAAGDDTLALSGASLGVGSNCTFAADVVANAAGSYANEIPAGRLATDQGLANPGPASATLIVVPPASVAKSFSPASIAGNGTSRSTLTITLFNTSASAITLTSDLVDALPGNVVVAPAPTNLGGTCTGTKSAAAGGTTVTLQSGATIPAAGSCTVTVDVVSGVGGSYVNVIAAGQMQTSAGNNQDPAIATLGVDQPAPPTIDKAFSPSTIFAGGTSTLTIAIGNPNATALTLTSAFTDTMPANVTLSGAPTTGCSGGGLSSTATTVTLAAGMQVPAGGCTITATVTSSTSGSYTNTIAASDLVTDGGSPPFGAEAPLVVKTLVPPGVRKSFGPGTINPGGTSTLTIFLDNENASSLTLASVLTDTLPSDVVVAPSPGIDGTCTKASVGAIAGGSAVTYASGATIPPGGCSITVDVTSAVPGGPYTNTIAAGALSTDAGANGAAAVANLFVNPFQPPSVSKSFTPTQLPKNGTSTLTISLGNGNAAAITLSGDFVDTLPANLVVATPNGLVTSAGCEAAKVQAPAGGTTVKYLATAALAANGGCTIQVNVTSANPGTYTNTIDAGALATSAGTNAIGASAQVQFVEWPTNSDLALTKAIAPNTNQAAGSVQTITLTWRNGNGSSPVRNVYQCSVVDTLPAAAYDLAADAPTAGTTPAGYAFSYDAVANTVTYTRTDTTTACETATQTATFSVRLKSGVATGSTYTNNVTLTAKTLPSNDPNAAAAATLTRSASATVAVTAPSTATKTATATSQSFTDPGDASVNANPIVAIGETVTFSVPFTLPAGVTNTVTLADDVTTGIGDVALVSATLARSSTGVAAASDPAGINAAAAGSPVDVAGLVVVVGNEFQLALGNVTNSSGASQTYTLVVSVRIANVGTNIAGHVVTDQGRLRYQNASGVAQSTVSGTKSVHVGLPGITAGKTVSPAAPAAGATVTYTLTLTNPSGTNAVSGFDLTFTDSLPADLENPSAPVFGVGSTGAVAAGSFAGNVLSGTIDRLDPGESVVVTYTAQVKPDTAFGKTIVNAASAQTTTLPGADANERTISSTAATATLTTATPSIGKAVIGAQSRYAIGDVVAYRVTVDLPTGTTTNLVVVDTLPAGLAYVAGSATIALSAGVTGPASGAVTPSPSSPLTFALGSVAAAAAGTITIDYLAQVQNVYNNQNGQTRVNAVQATYDKPDGGTSTMTVASPPSIVIGEPNFTMAKTIVSGATGAQAGSTVRWRYTVQNAGTTIAYQATIADQLPSGLAGISNATVVASGGNVQVSNAGCTSGAAVGNANAVVSQTVNPGDTLTVAGICIAPGATMTVDFDTVVQNNVAPGQVLTNIVRGSYASQPTGTSGTAVVRDGADGGDDDTDPAAACNGTTNKCNNYSESASNTLTIAAPIAIDKQASATTATIGQTVTYAIKVSLIQGNTPSVVIEDVLPSGLSYVGHSIAFGHIGMTPSNAAYATRLGTGQTVRFDFGSVQNDANGDAADDWIQIDLQVRVDNILANQGGVVLRNGEGGTVTVRYGAGPTTVTYDYDGATPGVQGRPLTLTEPILTAAKAAVPTAQSLGDVVTYTITLSHTGASTADAYDVTLTDTLATGLAFVPGSVTPASAYVGISGQVLSLRVDPVDPLTLAKHSTTITYQARLAPSAAVGTPLANSVAGTWASTIGATGAADSGRNGSGGVDDYTFATAANVTPTVSAFLDATKTVAIEIDADASGDLTPGDTLRYTVVLRNTNGAADGVVFTDPIPANTTYATGSATTSKGSIVASASLLTVNVGPMASAETVTIAFDVTVNAGTPTGTVISNQGRVDSDRTVPEPTDADGIDANGDQPTEIVVGGRPTPAAALYAEKLVALQSDADASGTVTQGDTMRYTIALHNGGGGTLHNVVFSDVIPTGLTYVAASAVAGTGTIGVSGATVSWSGIGSLASDAVVTATFDVTVGVVTPPSQTFTNQGAASSTETPAVLTDSNGNPSDGNQPTQFVAVGGGGAAQPILDLQKRWSLAVDTPPTGVASPGDTLLYTITVANRGSANALNVRLTDPVPTCSGALNPCTAYVAGTLATSQGAVVSESPIDVNLGTLAPGATATLTFRVVVSGSTGDGVLIANQASATYTGGSGPVPSDDNGMPADGINPTLTPISTATGGAGTPGSFAKQLAGSSETASTGSGVLVGEVIRYRISVAMPKGTTRQVTIADVLPPGLAYLPGSARLAHTFDTGLVSSANPGGINGAASGTYVALPDGSGIAVGSGAGGTTTLDVFLGDVIDSDADTAAAETYALEYRAVVRNDAGNQAGTTLPNAATVRFWNALGQTQSLTPSTVTTTVAEPAMALTKAASPPSLLSNGGTTRFTLVLSNGAGANAAPAFDIALSDVLPASFTIIGPRAVTSAGATGVVDNTSGTAMAFAIDRLDPGGSVTIAFDATAAGPLATGPIVNNANVTWTSLPGANGSAADGASTPGTPGSATGERTGAGGVNDYSATAAATVTVGSVAMVKSIVNAKSRYAIGDVVDYRVDIGVPGSAFGALGSVVLTDVLGAGLTYVPGSLAIAWSGVSAATPPPDFSRTDNAPAAGQETLVASFGSLTNTGASAATVTLTYRAAVDNVLGNQANATLGNAATLTYADPGAGGAAATIGPSTTSVTVGEPFLALAKTLDTPGAGLRAGSVASFTVTVGNTGTTTAYETVVSDPLPAGLQLTGGVTVTPSNVSGALQVPTVTAGAGSWLSTPFDLPPGDSVTFTFSTVLASSVQPGQVLQNGVAASYGSRDGADPGERTGASPGSNQGDDSQLDNYNASAASATITVDDPVAIAKSFHPDASRTRYAIGQQVTYRLTLSVLEGTTRSVRVTDTLPAGLTFVSAGTPGTLPGAPITFTYAGAPTLAGQVVTFDLGDVVDQPNGTAADDKITIDVTARVDNVVANQDGTVLGNHSRVAFVDAGGTPRTRDFDADGGTPGVQPLDLLVAEPAVVVTKGADPASQSLGDLVTFTLNVAHTAASHADAYDLVLVDTLPAGLAFEPGSVNPPGVFGSIAGQTLTLDAGTLTLADANRTITYQARVRTSAAPGVAQTNAVAATWAGTPGASGAPTSGRNGSGGINDYRTTASSSVTPNTNAQVRADKSVALVVDADGSGHLTGGDTIEWTIVLSNGGPAITGVVFTDTVPSDTSYGAGSLVATKGSPSAVPPQLTVNIGAMAPSEQVTIRFRTLVANGLQRGTVLSNQGSVDSDQTVPTPTDSDGDPGNGAQPTTITVQGAPDLAIAKTHAGDFIQGQLGAAWSIVVRNIGTAPTSGTVTVEDTLPAGMAVRSIAGSGWACTPTPVACTRGDALAVGAAWPAITLVVDLDPLIQAGTVTNTVAVSGTGDFDPSNNVASDPVVVRTQVLLPPETSKAVYPNGRGGFEWRIVVVNSGNVLPMTVRVIDPIPVELDIAPGSLACQARGSTVVSGCTYDAATRKIVVDARLGPDFGHAESAAANALVVTFRSTLHQVEGSIVNRVEVRWDANSTGIVGDEPGQVPVVATAAYAYARGVPVGDPRMLIVLAGVMIMLAARRLGGRRASSLRSR